MGGETAAIWGAILGAVVGAAIASLVAWAIHHSSIKHARDLLQLQLKHGGELMQAQLKHNSEALIYQTEWPWYREVLQNAAIARQGAFLSMQGNGTREWNAKTSVAVTFLASAKDVMTRTNTLAFYAIRDIISALHQALAPGKRSPQEQDTISNQLSEASLRLSRILAKSAGLEPELLAEELLAEGHLGPLTKGGQRTNTR